ncbi:YhdP family protein [Siccirubricoccus phaeus]|uniref:YhdP family protein n=1 Tax=Siccirubricoccus phaeus TaxID=2595053 RepID=UPI0011F10176|nr:DUF3971 domain-containing protein [Siccirubricoccus phaeus]
MSRARGQALHWVPRAGNWVLGLVVGLGLCLGALAWRLAEAPLEVPALARRIEAAVNAELGEARLTIGRADIAWEGFRGGTAAPLDIVLRNVVLRDADGTPRVELPDAAVTLSARALLRGMVAPSVIELRQPRVLALLRPDGSFGLTLNPAPEALPPEGVGAPEKAAETPATAPGSDALGLLAALMQPASDRAAYAALRRLRVNGGEVVLAEVATGKRWSLVDPQLDLRRAAGGGLAGEGSASFHAGAVVMPVRLSGAAEGAPMQLRARIALPALRPAELAEIWPGLAPLRPLDAPVALSAGASFDAALRPLAVEIGLDGEAGEIVLGPARLPIARFSARLAGGMRALRLTAAELELPGGPGGGPGGGPVLSASGTALKGPAGWQAQLDLRSSPVTAEALPRLWPAELAPEARAALLTALPAGRLRSAWLQLDLALPESLENPSWQAARLDLGLDQAVLRLGEAGSLATESLDLTLAATPDRLRLESLALHLPGPAGPRLGAAGEAMLAEGEWRGGFDLTLDQANFAELASWWPEGIARGARGWIIRNLTAGQARNGTWRVEGKLGADLAGFALTGLHGKVEAHEAVVHWLRPVPPIQGVSGTAEFSGTEITLHAQGGRQMLGETQRGGMELREGQIRFFSLEAEPPMAEMAFQLAGPLPDILTTLRHPRLKLFERRKLELQGTGQVEARLNLALPLLNELPAEELRLAAEVKLAEGRLQNVLAGQALERVALEMAVTAAGLRANGQGMLLDQPVRLGVEMDFRAGPASQVVERTSVTGKLDQGQLATLGLETLGLLDGPVAVEARLEKRRSGEGRATLRGDLREARLALDGLGWRKPVGVAGQAEAVLRLQGDTLQSAEGIRLEAPDLLLRGRALLGPRARLERLELAEGAIGASRFQGEVRRPARDGAPWQAVLRGPVFDLRPILASEEGRAEAAPAAPPPPAGEDPPLALDLGFDRVTMGEGRTLFAMQATGRTDRSGLLREAQVQGRTSARAGAEGAGRFSLSLAPRGDERLLRIAAEDGGALLRALDVLDSIQGGRLTVTASYRELRPGAPLTGTAELEQFVVQDAPAVAKLMQAMTLYGLVEALQGGSGLVFARLVAPFALTPGELVLRDARAFSASLGLTAKGRIRRQAGELDIEGTIVPAYVFNTLLGNIPLLGRLFSPEAGGGVFAGTYAVRGRLTDPEVSVNPLAALTPGFLRGIFGLRPSEAPPGTGQPQTGVDR